MDQEVADVEIIIDGFPTKDEAESWMERNVKKQDWRPAKVEQVKEHFPKHEDHTSSKKKN